MPYEITRYHCSICREPYKKHAEALRCERQNHHARTVWPSKASQSGGEPRADAQRRATPDLPQGDA